MIYPNFVRGISIPCKLDEKTMMLRSLSKIDIAENAYNHRNGGRIVLLEEIGNVALFLASDAANGITGQIIAVDGGASL